MAALSDALETALLNHLLRNISYTSPVTVYLALFTADPTDAGTGAEVTGGSYARQAITFNAPSGGVATNSSQEDYLNMPGATVTHLGLFDAATAGVLLFHGPLTESKVVNAGDTFTVNAGDLSVSLA